MGGDTGFFVRWRINRCFFLCEEFGDAPLSRCLQIESWIDVKLGFNSWSNRHVAYLWLLLPLLHLQRHVIFLGTAWTCTFLMVFFLTHQQQRLVRDECKNFLQSVNESFRFDFVHFVGEFIVDQHDVFFAEAFSRPDVDNFHTFNQKNLINLFSNFTCWCYLPKTLLLNLFFTNPHIRKSPSFFGWMSLMLSIRSSRLSIFLPYISDSSWIQIVSNIQKTLKPSSSYFCFSVINFMSDWSFSIATDLLMAHLKVWKMLIQQINNWNSRV